MNPPESTHGKRDEPYTIIATVKSKWYSIAHIISILLLIASIGLAIVNYLTYSKMAKYNVETINNYKIRNRPFVKITPISIIVNKEQTTYPKTGQIGSYIFPKFRLKNFGQFPAFIENIDIWITDNSGDLKDFKFPRADAPKNTENLALFQGEEEHFDEWRLFFSNEYIERIKNEKLEDYCIFKTNYKILSNEKSLQKEFSYWIKCKHYKFDDNQKNTVYNFKIIKCGTDDKSPDI